MKVKHTVFQISTFCEEDTFLDPPYFLIYY